MIVESLLGVIYWLLDNLLIFEIPKMPAGVQEYMDIAFDYFTGGAAILNNFVPVNYLSGLLGAIIAIEAMVATYRLVMWVLKKIPMASIT